jgi:hypothetical protein
MFKETIRAVYHQDVVRACHQDFLRLSSSPGIKGTGVQIHENIDLFIQTYKSVFSSKSLGAVCEMRRKGFK